MSMPEAIEENIKTWDFSPFFRSKYAECYSNKDKKMIVCILTGEYVPINEFRNVFNELLKEIRNSKYTRFIFDKRSLRTFHQPSMEWYYLDWKTRAFEYGLKEHRKILPDLKWFVKAVEIAKRDLEEKLPEKVRIELDISYCNSLSEAINE